MKRDKKTQRLAKTLVQLSKDEEGMVSAGKVQEVLDGLKQIAPRNLLATLRTYLGLIRRELALQTAEVSTPTALDESVLRQIEAAYSKRYGRKIVAVEKSVPSLIAGVRVRVGDDVYDASVAGQLKRLGENVH